MADFSALGSALYSLLDSATALPVYYAIAPQGTPPPYVVFNRQGGRDEYTFTGHGVDAKYLIKVVTLDPWPTSAERTYDAIHTAVQNGGSVSGYQLLRMRRANTVEFRDDKNAWHVGGLYDVEVWG
jgi:hypothetical protein